MVDTVIAVVCIGELFEMSEVYVRQEFGQILGRNRAIQRIAIFFDPIGKKRNSTAGTTKIACKLHNFSPLCIICGLYIKRHLLIESKCLEISRYQDIAKPSFAGRNDATRQE
jgi:hypothetical protein